MPHALTEEVFKHDSQTRQQNMSCSARRYRSKYFCKNHAIIDGIRRTPPMSKNEGAADKGSTHFLTSGLPGQASFSNGRGKSS